MNTKRDTPPSNLRSLQARIDSEAAARNQPVRRIMRAIANVAVGQMLPPSVVKGGTAMKLRVGEPGSRFTPDFDASRSAEITLDDYIDELADLLAGGWSGFTGTVEPEDVAAADGVPTEYVMQPFSIRRHPSGRGWAIHPLTHLGDVIEFGADGEAGLDRWYGFTIDAGSTSLCLVGPYATPVEACDDGSRSLRPAAEIATP